MAITAANILDNIHNQQLGPIYILDGTEPYYIDQLVKAFEEHGLPPEEKDFGLTILYGNEVDYKTVINQAQTSSMFGGKTLVILKEAQQMKTLNELAVYVANPNPNATLVIEHKDKNLDKRGKLYKSLGKKVNHFTADKIKDYQLPNWIIEQGKEQGLIIEDKIAQTLAAYLGNDLKKIVNEFEKVRINEPENTVLTAAMVEQYIGISKEYNMFELADAVMMQQQERIARMLNYFIANPKNAPLPPIVASFYTFLNKAFLCHYTIQDFNADRKLGIYQNTHRVFAQQHGLAKIHRLFVLLEEFSNKAVGIGSNTLMNPYILKETIAKFQVLLQKR